MTGCEGLLLEERASNSVSGDVFCCCSCGLKVWGPTHKGLNPKT